MKTLLTLIILTTIATEAQVVNIHEPDRVYAEIPHTYTPITTVSRRPSQSTAKGAGTDRREDSISFQTSTRKAIKMLFIGLGL